MPDVLRKFVYVSRTCLAPEQDSIQLDVIRATSASNNRRYGITGSLLHAPGFFAQYVEGPQTAIEELIGRLQRDPRHTDIRGVGSDLNRAIFRNWSFSWTGSASFMSRALAELHRRTIDYRLERRLVWMMQQFGSVQVERGARIPEHKN